MNKYRKLTMIIVRRRINVKHTFYLGPTREINHGARKLETAKVAYRTALDT